METITLELEPSFYSKSPYAKFILKEENNDSSGLIFYEFIHELGVLLECDVIFKQIDPATWLLANDDHVQVIYHRKIDDSEQLDFTAKSNKGIQLIQALKEKELLNINMPHIKVH